jgi:hypothetical protein
MLQKAPPLLRINAFHQLQLVREKFYVYSLLGYEVTQAFVEASKRAKRCSMCCP